MDGAPSFIGTCLVMIDLTRMIKVNIFHCKYILNRELRPRSILVVVESLTEQLSSLLHCIFGSLLPLISSKECGLNILESVIWIETVVWKPLISCSSFYFRFQVSLFANKLHQLLFLFQLSFVVCWFHDQLTPCVLIFASDIFNTLPDVVSLELLTIVISGNRLLQQI